LLTPQALLLKLKTRKDFIGVLKGEGVDEALVARLVENNVKTAEGAIELGVEGLTALLGADAETAEKILELARTFSAERQARAAEAETAATEPGAASEPEKEPRREDREYSLNELKGIDEKIIAILSENGFQTLAELSITPLEELIAIEGIDDVVAREIIEQARQHTEKLENV
jgi:N utilization substance protein A